MASGVARQIHTVLGKLDQLTSGQAKVIRWNEDEIKNMVIEMAPNSGYYKGGRFAFEIVLPGDFPDSPPQVTCLNDIYHPNIDPTESYDNVCVNILQNENWCPKFGLQGCILGVLFLFHHPNFEDPFSSVFQFRHSEADYKRDIEKSLHGGRVGFLQEVIDEAIGEVLHEPSVTCTSSQQADGNGGDEMKQHIFSRSTSKSHDVCDQTNVQEPDDICKTSNASLLHRTEDDCVTPADKLTSKTPSSEKDCDMADNTFTVLPSDNTSLLQPDSTEENQNTCDTNSKDSVLHPIPTNVEENKEEELCALTTHTAFDELLYRDIDIESTCESCDSDSGQADNTL